MAENKTFTLVGKFDDQITKKLREINREIRNLSKPLKKDSIASSLAKDFKRVSEEVKKVSKNIDSLGGSMKGISKPINGLIGSLEDAGKAAGKVRDTVSQIGEGVKGLDGISESLAEAARAAGRAQEEVAGIGEAAGRATGQAEGLMSTLLQAEGLSKLGDALASGFERGISSVISIAEKASRTVGRLFKESMDDELADVKAASGVEGSFRLAGYEGSFTEAKKMYKKYDQVVSEMIRQSSAPTAKVVELQRYTLDTMGPLMLAAEGVAKGTKMKDIDPKKVTASAENYGKFLEKVALFSQGTGSQGFQVAAGVEQLVTRGKIDTTMDFFTDNIMLMKNLEDAGFAGRGKQTSKLTSATDAQRMKAMMEAFNKSMSSESTRAMAESLTGSLQGLQDTIFNPSVGILGMSVTFSKEEQKKANQAIIKIQNARIDNYRKELANTKTSAERAKQLRVNIEQAAKTRDALTKDGADEISTPFKAFSYAFSDLIRSLTEAMNAIGPVWTQFSLAAIEVTNKVFGPLGETLKNVASNMRGGEYTQAEGFGRIAGEIFKTIGEIMGDIANMIGDPKGALGKVQSEFIKGFMDAFGKDPKGFQKAVQSINKGLEAILKKFFSIAWNIVSTEAIRPLVLTFIAAIFGPPLITAVIASATPLIALALVQMAKGAFTGSATGSATGAATGAAAGAGARLRFLGSALKGNFATAAKYGAKVPGVGKASALVKGAQMKAIGAVAAGMVTLATKAPALKDVGKSVVSLGKRIPGLSLAFAGLDLTTRIASGENAATAVSGVGGGLAGGAIGATLGTVLLPFLPGIGTVLGGIIGTFIGDWAGSKLPALFSGLPGLLQAAWSGLEKWFRDLPWNLGMAIGRFRVMANNSMVRLYNWFFELSNKFGSWVSRTVTDLRLKWNNFLSQAAALWQNKDRWGILGNAIVNGLKAMISNLPIVQLFTNVRGAAAGVPGFISGAANTFSQALRAGERLQTNLTPREELRTRVRSKGALGDAISSEMRNKPSGSDLVIANSSETIIPAAGGLGMGDFMKSLDGGFARIVNSINASNTIHGDNGKRFTDGLHNVSNQVIESQKEINSLGSSFSKAQQYNATMFSSIREEVSKNQNQTLQMFGKLSSQVSQMSMMGGGMGVGIGMGSGNLGMASSLAQSMGLIITSTTGGKHAPGSYHYAGRAIDVGGNPGAMLAYARRLASTSGGRMAELYHTPLGFSIKNGVRVPWTIPNHTNHVHVAYGYGPGNPAFFSSQGEAKAWERKVSPAFSKVSSITSNSSEGFGSTTLNAPITIYQQPYQDSEELATLVAMRISMVIDELRNH